MFIAVNGSGYVPLLSFSMTVTISLGKEWNEIEKKEEGWTYDVQLVAVPNDGAYSPLGRVSAFVAEIAQDHISPRPPSLQRGVWVALSELDAASIPLEYGTRSDDGQSIVGMHFRRLSSSGLTRGLVESGGEIRFERDDDVDALTEGV